MGSYISVKRKFNYGYTNVFPIDGKYRGRIFVRAFYRDGWGEWTLLSNFSGDYNDLNHRPDAECKQINIYNSILQLEKEKFQRTNMQNNTTIRLPQVNSFTEIHLFFNTTSELTLTFPSGIKYQKEPLIQENKTYEFIFTYVNGQWFCGYVEYQ